MSVQLEEAVLDDFEVQDPDKEDPAPQGIARFCTLPPKMEADFLHVLWQEIMKCDAVSDSALQVLIMSSDVRQDSRLLRSILAALSMSLMLLRAIFSPNTCIMSS